MSQSFARKIHQMRSTTREEISQKPLVLRVKFQHNWRTDNITIDKNVLQEIQTDLTEFTLLFHIYGIGITGTFPS